MPLTAPQQPEPVPAPCVCRFSYQRGMARHCVRCGLPIPDDRAPLPIGRDTFLPTTRGGLYGGGSI